MCSRLSGVDDSEIVAFFGVGHNDQAMIRRMTDREEPWLPHGMVGIRNGARQWIAEDRGRLLERNAVLSFVLFLPFRCPM